MTGSRRCLRALVAAAAACLAAGRTTPVIGKVQVANSSEVLAESLRRQLMKDNYDYSSSESEQPAARRAGRGGATTTQLSPDTSANQRNMLKLRKNNQRLRRYLYRKLAKRKKRVLKNMYDINEDMGERFKLKSKYQISNEDDSVTDRNINRATTVMYKILKLRNPYRRSGDAMALMQEESPQGVSIVKLGRGPFPEFRLEPARRQYMRGPRPLRALGDHERELPPPPLDPTDLTPAPSDAAMQIKNETNTFQNHVPKSIFNGGEYSLKITVTPDEIFVL